MPVTAATAFPVIAPPTPCGSQWLMTRRRGC